jgi:hypothetical protein
MATQTLFTVLALSLIGAVSPLPASAQFSLPAPGQVAQFTNAPQIDSFTVTPVSQLTPGTELVFTLQGTPNGQASFTLGNLATNIPMRETEPGVYQGRYTIRTQDRLSNNTVVRANLAQGGRIASTRLEQPLVGDTGTGNQPNQSGLYIDRFTVQPASQVTPGTELTFTLTGTPNAIATFTIAGIAVNQPMREVSPGIYEGEYVIRSRDVFPAGGTPVTGRLRSGQQVVQAQLNPSLGAGSGSGTPTGQIPLEIISPANNSRVSGTVEVRGRSAPNTIVNVNVNAVTSLAGVVGLNRNVLTRTVQTDSQGNFSFSFNSSLAVRGTRYEVSLTAGQGTQSNPQTLVLIRQ